eukprot:2284222-Prymnesium_polylepis.1
MGTDVRRQLIVSSSADASLKVWRLSDGKLLGSLEGHQRPITSFQLSGTRVISASMDRSVRCWELQPLLEAADCDDGQPPIGHGEATEGVPEGGCATPPCQLFSIAAHDDFVRSVRFNHQLIVSCGDDGKVRTPVASGLAVAYRRCRPSSAGHSTAPARRPFSSVIRTGEPLFAGRQLRLGQRQVALGAEQLRGRHTRRATAAHGTLAVGCEDAAAGGDGSGVGTPPATLGWMPRAIARVRSEPTRSCCIGALRRVHRAGGGGRRPSCGRTRGRTHMGACKRPRSPGGVRREPRCAG